MQNNFPAPGESASQRILSAALNGSIEDQYRLAYLLETGTDMEKSLGNAIGWYQKAATRGHLESTFRLGLMYMSPGFENHTLALYWLELAAAKRHAGAIYQLSLMYEGGKGVDPDHTRALELCREAAALGSPCAAKKLDFMNSWMTTDCSKEVEKYTSTKSVLPSNFEIPRKEKQEHSTTKSFLKHS